MGKRAVFAFKGITQLHNHENASNLSVRLKFSSLLFLGMKNLMKRNTVTYGEPSRYSPGAARAAPPYGLAHCYPQMPQFPQALSSPSPACSKNLMPF